MNIVLIISDTFRYDNLFDWAEMPVRTPHLDAFAQRAVSASRMYAGSFPTIPHRTDVLSGRHTWLWHPWQPVLQSTKNIMPRFFKEYGGHVTQLLGDCPMLMRSGFGSLFDAAHIIRGQECDVHYLHMNDPIENVMPPEKTRHDEDFQGNNLVDMICWQNAHWRYEEDRFSPQTARLTARWLEDNYRYHPFFLWVDFFDPHEANMPPEYMVRNYDPDYVGPPMLHFNYGKASDLTPAELKNMRAHYCADAELVDRSVGRILQKLDDCRLWSNSIVIFTSDHGTCLGERNRTGKSNRNPADDRRWPLCEKIAHVPFLIAAPGLEGGRTIDALLQPSDILPTLLDLAGLDIEPEEPFHGKSFAPMLRGEAQESLRKFAVTGMYRRNDYSPNTETPVLRTDKWAYVPIGSDGERELYNLEIDPVMETDVASDHPRVMRGLHAKLSAWLQEIAAPQEAIETLLPPH